MKKSSPSLVLLCLVVTVLLLACSHDGEAVAPLPKGSINAADRREFKKSEVNEQFNLGPFHATLEKFEYGGFTLKKHQKFSVYTTPKEVINDHSAVILNLRLKQKSGGKSHA